MTRCTGDTTIPAEPLDESAPVAWAIAPTLCPGNPLSEESCLWYHRVWQYLRLLDIINPVRTNSAFLTGAFEHFADDHPRVLISGSADYAMLAHVRHGYGNHACDITVVDRCSTSLHINSWYARRFGFEIATASGSALDYDNDQAFDLICTHNFIGQFEAASRRRLLASWHALLRPGGIVITTQRVRPGTDRTRNRFTADEAHALSARVVEAAAVRPGFAGADLKELADVVYQYALRKGGYTIHSTREIAELFEDEGFELELMDEGGGGAERERDKSSSNFEPESFRMRVIARRR